MSDFYEWMANGSGITWRHQIVGAGACFVIALVAGVLRWMTAPKKRGSR